MTINPSVGSMALAAVMLAGCTSLAWKPDDSIAMKTAKVAVRAPLVVATLGFSEAILEHNLDEEAEAREAARVEEGRARKAAYMRSLMDKASAYRVQAENAKTPEERDTAIALLDSVLEEMRIVSPQAPIAVDPEPQTCVAVPVGNVLVSRCQ